MSQFRNLASLMFSRCGVPHPVPFHEPRERTGPVGRTVPGEPALDLHGCGAVAGSAGTPRPTRFRAKRPGSLKSGEPSGLLAARQLILLASLGAWCLLAALRPGPLGAQAPWPFPPLTTPEAQRNALNGVRSQVSWLQNATRTAANYGPAGYDKIWQEFQTLRGAYGVFRSTLTPLQLNAGANDLAELDAGLDILQEAFGNYQADLAARRPMSSALRNLGQVLARGSGVWGQELNRVSGRLRVGWP